MSLYNESPFRDGQSMVIGKALDIAWEVKYLSPDIMVHVCPFCRSLVMSEEDVRPHVVWHVLSDYDTFSGLVFW